jgi:hypothetical protein
MVTEGSRTNLNRLFMNTNQEVADAEAKDLLTK